MPAPCGTDARWTESRRSPSAKNQWGLSASGQEEKLSLRECLERPMSIASVGGMDFNTIFIIGCCTMQFSANSKTKSHKINCSL